MAEALPVASQHSTVAFSLIWNLMHLFFKLRPSGNSSLGQVNSSVPSQTL